MSELSNDYRYQWYIVTVVSGKEELVISNLWYKIIAAKYEDHVRDIKVIKETIVEQTEYDVNDAPSSMRETAKIKWETITNENGEVVKYRKTKTETKNKFPGYIYINMNIDDQLWFLIRNTELVTGLVGSSGKNSKPIPISDSEITKILELDKNEQVYEIQPNTKKHNIQQAEFIPCNFEIGNLVKINNGSMKEQKGFVKSINNQKGQATIKIEILGQSQEFNIDFRDLELVK